MKSELILSTISAVLMMGADCCNKQHRSPSFGETMSGPGVSRLLDAGLGNGQAPGTRSDPEPAPVIN